MNFQNTLLKRKGRFGTIWLAAHHPSKISKIEIVQLNLSRKCDEIIEFVLNGREDRPKFSLVVSSHLMYGLCVLIKKQNQYLYDDLIYLKQEIHKCYISDKLVLKKEKTPRKRAKPAERTIITLKENLPELITSFETFYETENERLRKALEESYEKHEHPKPHIQISLVEEPLEPTTIIQAEDFQFDTGMAFLQVENFQDTYFNIENLERTKVTSTAKFADRVQPRIPFKELSTNEQYRRAELTTTIAQDQGTTIYDELESLLHKRTEAVENVPPGGELPLPLPELYQETIFEPSVAVPLVEPTVEATEVTIAPVEKTVVPAVEVTIEPERVEITKVRGKKEKKRGLIIDQVTEFTKADLAKRIKKSEDREHEEIELSQMFAKSRQEIKLNYDYLHQDLLKQPSNLMMRRTNRIYSNDNLRHFVQTKLIMPVLKSNKLKADEYFYTTESRRYEPTESLISLEVEERREARESTSKGRKRESTTNLEMESAHTSSKLTKDSTGGTRLNLEESNTINYQEQYQFESIPQMYPHEETPAIYIQPPSPVRVEKVVEVDNFEKFLIDEIHKREEKNEIPILQDIIKKADLRDIGEQNRRKFATKLFRQTLMMCKDNKLNAKQEETYSDIELNLI